MRVRSIPTDGLTLAPIAVAAALLVAAVGCGPRPGELRTYREVGDFQLTERSGKVVSRADLAGRIWVANFFFAGCVSECSLVMDRLAQLQEKLGDRPDVVLVSFTTDPRSDTPEALRKFAAKLNADPERWLFLTGDRKVILRVVVHSFLMPITRNPRDQADLLSGLVHTDKLALVDRTGTIRAYFDGLKPEASDLILKAIDQLAAQSPRSAPVATNAGAPRTPPHESQTPL
jgi:cytochrome oxidase Cu insertion factor (SCO1/SenC/PrrC family)